MTRAPLAPALRCGLLLLTLATCGPAQALSFDDVARRARDLAAAPYEAPEQRLPREVLELDYDQYRDIRFRPEKSLWRDGKLPFEVQFFHPGLFYTQPVRINIVTGRGVRPLRFDPAAFD